MKVKVITIIFTLFVGVVCHAQVSYTYDDSGNRNSRYIPLKSAEIESDSSLANEAVISDETIAIEFEDPALQEQFGELEVKLYPNPTKGAVYINLNQLPANETPIIEIWSPNGALIEKDKIEGLTTRINLWGKPGGVYIIKSVINGTPHSWKIIKE